MSGWPNEDKPGYPVDPETSCWHWLQCGSCDPMPWKWLASTEIEPKCAWGNGDGRELTVDGAGRNWTYLGPALTPAELADVVGMIGKAAAEAMNRILADIYASEEETKH